MTNPTPLRYAAVFLLENSYPELKDADIVIGAYEDSRVSVGVKARYRVFKKTDDGRVKVHEEQAGNYCFVDKDSTVSEFLTSLREMFDSVSAFVEEAQKGDKA